MFLTGIIIISTMSTVHGITTSAPGTTSTNTPLVGGTLSTNNVPTNTRSRTTSKSTTIETSEQTLVERHNGVGLVIDSGKIEIKRGIENLIIGISYPVISNITKINKIINEIDQSIITISKTPGLRNKLYNDQLINSFMSIHEDLIKIQKIYYDMSQYPDPKNIIEPNYDCHLEYSIIDEEYVTDLQLGIKSFMGRLDLTLTENQISTDKQKLDDLITTVILIKDFIDQSKDELGNRMTELDSITLGNIPPSLPYTLETLSCIQSGQIELVALNYCTKCNYGIFCQLEINSVSSSQEYTRFEPVNYDGAQIRFETDTQVLLQSSEGHWELLDCKNELEDQYDELELLDELLECKTKPVNNPCIDNLFSTDYSIILDNCNFTYRLTPRIITRTKNYGFKKPRNFSERSIQHFT